MSEMSLAAKNRSRPSRSARRVVGMGDQARWQAAYQTADIDLYTDRRSINSPAAATERVSAH